MRSHVMSKCVFWSIYLVYNESIIMGTVGRMVSARPVYNAVNKRNVYILADPLVYGFFLCP